MTVAITGATGLIGIHLIALFKAKNFSNYVTIDRGDWLATEKLAQKISGCTALVHLAFKNRGDEPEVKAENDFLAAQLLTALEQVPSLKKIIYSDSIHSGANNTYGRTKAAVGDALASHADRENISYLRLTLPHLFGEYGKPFHNSAVSTFCHQLARGEKSEVHVDGQVELLHAGVVAARIFSALNENFSSGEEKMPGKKMSIPDVYQKLEALAGVYRRGDIPEYADLFTQKLFNTLRSYWYPDLFPFRLELKSDHRGVLFETCRAKHSGQAFISTTYPKKIRGNHFHLDKLERFCVILGQGVIRMRRVDQTQIYEYPLSGETPMVIDMPPLVTHSIENTSASEAMMTFFWTDTLFDPAHPDTYGADV